MNDLRYTREPRGGRMGVPKCGGEHGVRAEHLCFDCKDLTLREEQIAQERKLCDLLEEFLILQTGLPPSGKRVKVKAPKDTSGSAPTGGSPPTNTIKGGIDVRARRPNAST